MSDRDPIFAAVDYGTGGAKCALFDAGGRCLAVAREPWTYREERLEDGTPTPGYSFDPDAFWAAIARCSRRALDDAGVRADAVRGIAPSAQRLGTVFLDAAGREIYAGPNMDGRGFTGAIDVMGRLGLERTVAITGHWPPFVSSLARLLVYRGGADRAAVDAILTLTDWLAYRLTGERVSEASNAGESLLLDVPGRHWSREALETFDIDPRLLPPLVEPGARIGSVSAEAAAATGFRVGTPVYAGGADTQCALLGSDVVAPDDAAAVLGTTTPVMAVTQAPVIDGSGRLWTGCHVLADRWTLESNGGDTGIGYQWLVELVGLSGDEGFRRAEEEIAALGGEPLPAFSIAGPQIFDLMSFNPNQATGFLFRMPPFTARPGRASFLRAFQENVACAVRGNLEQVEAVLGREVRCLTLSGGMTRSPSLLRAFARILRRPLLVSEEPNATALGCAVLAAAGDGAYGSIAEAAAAMVRRRPLAPEDDLRDAYDAHYARWRELYGQFQATSI
jgi:sugar (pentulose or hexulose) kinase